MNATLALCDAGIALDNRFWALEGRYGAEDVWSPEALPHLTELAADYAKHVRALWAAKSLSAPWYADLWYIVDREAAKISGRAVNPPQALTAAHPLLSPESSGQPEQPRA